MKEMNAMQLQAVLYFIIRGFWLWLFYLFQIANSVTMLP